MRERSIRTRLALRLGVVVFASYAVFSLALFAYFSRTLVEDLDAFLASRAEGVVESIRAYARAAGRGRMPDRSPGPAGFRELARLWTDESAGSALLLSAGVQIFGLDGASLAATHGLDAVIDLSPEALRRARKGLTTIQDAQAAEERGGVRDFRVLTLPVNLGAGQVLAVQVMVPRTRVEKALTVLRLLLALLAPAAALAAGAVAALVARNIVAPLAGMAVTLRRITERKLGERVPAPRGTLELSELAAAFNTMMDRMERAFTEQVRFTDDAAHQLRTPLTVLRGELELALKRARSSDEYERVLESNLEEVERMVRLVGRMLELARLDAGRVQFSARPLRLDALIREVAEDLEPLAEAKGLRFDLSALAPASVAGDPVRLRQVFMNLAENAVAYGRPGTAVQLASWEVEGGARASVRDRGAGIPPEEVESIFLRFHRGSNASGSGYGIGLSFARSATELHGGTLIAANHPEGGALFLAAFPKIT